MALLLLAVAAPAGFVMAAEQRSPYVVVFKDQAVTREVADTQVYVVRLPADARRKQKSHREVDGARVSAHVAEIKARIRLRVGNVYSSSLGGFSADLTPGQVVALERDPAVAAVVRDEEFSIDDGLDAGVREAGGVRTTTSQHASVPAGIRRVGAQHNALARVDGRDSRVDADVAIIDTGVQRDHPDLNVVGGYNCTGPNRSKWDDVDGHGTHVAGIVGALDNRFGVVGVAPGVRLWSVKVLGPRGSGRMSWLLCGVDWVTSQRDKTNQRKPLFEVANLSISFAMGRDRGSCRDELTDGFHAALCRSIARGTVYVAAAGNESHNARRNRPAAYDEVITVSALADYDGRGGGQGYSGSCPYWTGDRDDAFTSFSNFGPDVDLIAPGRCVLSTYKRSRYAWLSGTSMATPHVTGAVAVYRAMYPRANPQQVRMALQAVGRTDWRVKTDPDRIHEKAVWMGTFRTMPDFAPSTGAGSGRVAAGGVLTLTVALARVGGFTDPVSVELVNVPDGFSATSVTSSDASATLRLKVNRAAAVGRYYLILRSASGDVEHASAVQVLVENPTN
jgi:subtilisin family serine protease